MTTTFELNGKSVTVETPEDATLLWTLRENLKLTGTKFGCGISACGACTVHLNGEAVRSCSLPVATLEGQKVTTIEGLSENNDHPLQLAFQEAQVPQCGYCQSGQIMQAATLLRKNSRPSREQIVQHMDGNLCRCGTYTRIIRAISNAATNPEA